MLFENRMQAGEMLAHRFSGFRDDPDAVVVALPRGGVPVGFALAHALDLPLDIEEVRKLGVPGREELAMGAVSSQGLCVLRAEVIALFDIPAEIIEAIAHRELIEIERRELLYRSVRPPVKLEGHKVIVVDDGLATGATMLAALRSLRARHPAKLIMAIPVAPLDMDREIEQEADEVIRLHTPDPFVAVGQWYRDFSPVTDEDVVELLTQARRFHIGDLPRHAKKHGARHRGPHA